MPCVFSNGIETRIGSLSAAWEHFFHICEAARKNKELTAGVLFLQNQNQYQTNM